MGRDEQRGAGRGSGGKVGAVGGREGGSLALDLELWVG